MKKSILNLKGAQELSKNEQKALNGGARAPQPTSGCYSVVGPNRIVVGCPYGYCCSDITRSCIPVFPATKSCFTQIQNVPSGPF